MARVHWIHGTVTVWNVSLWEPDEKADVDCKRRCFLEILTS